MAVYVDSLGLGATVAGLMSVSFAVFAIAGRISAGFFSDRLSRRTVLAAGCLIFSVGSLLFGVVPVTGLLIVFRGLQGSGYSAVNTAASTACVDLAPEGKLSRNMSQFWSANAISLAVAGFVTQYFMSAGRHVASFTLAAAVLFVAFLVALTFRFERPEPEENVRRGFLESIFERRAVPAFAVLLLLAVSHSAIAIYILVYAERLGITGIAGAYSLTAAIAMVLANMVCPGLIKRFGYMRPLAVGSMIFGLATLLLAFHGAAWTVLLAGAAFGLLLGVPFPILNTLAVKDLPYERRGVGSGTALLALDIGVGFGGFICGRLIDLSGFGTMFTVAAVLSFAAAILAVPLFRRA